MYFDFVLGDQIQQTFIQSQQGLLGVQEFSDSNMLILPTNSFVQVAKALQHTQQLKVNVINITNDEDIFTMIDFQISSSQITVTETLEDDLNNGNQPITLIIIILLVIIVIATIIAIVVFQVLKSKKQKMEKILKKQILQEEKEYFRRLYAKNPTDVNMSTQLFQCNKMSRTIARNYSQNNLLNSQFIATQNTPTIQKSKLQKTKQAAEDEEDEELQIEQLYQMEMSGSSDQDYEQMEDIQQAKRNLQKQQSILGSFFAKNYTRLKRTNNEQLSKTDLVQTTKNNVTHPSRFSTSLQGSQIFNASRGNLYFNVQQPEQASIQRSTLRKQFNQILGSSTQLTESQITYKKNNSNENSNNDDTILIASIIP